MNVFTDWKKQKNKKARNSLLVHLVFSQTKMYIPDQI